MTARVLEFGGFRLSPERRELRLADKSLHVGSRALDVLIALIEQPGKVVSNSDLIARVWPDTFVDDANLRVHISALRKALGDGKDGVRYIANVPGRGYSFVAPVQLGASEAIPDSLVPAVQTPAVHNLPALLTRPIGREEAIDALVKQLPKRRFMTVVGPGGIGKTTVALAVGERLAPSYQHGVCLVDFSALGDPSLVPSALAAGLRIPSDLEDPTPNAVAFLRDRTMLLLLDSCEAVLPAVATLAEAILRGSPRSHVLATSREPIRGEGEWLHRLGPLAVPPAMPSLTAEEAMAYPAVQLFAERVAACIDGYTLTDADAPLIAEICRRLDGIALAIELIASRFDAFGVHGLSALLNDHFAELTSGRRTALPRHQTLGATLDWSHDRLSEKEQILLRRLAAFAGDFTLEALCPVVSGAEIEVGEVPRLIADLIAKSLVIADVGSDIVRYRLLDTTRAYALRKLVASGEFAATGRSHAEYYRNLLERANIEAETWSTDEWLSAYAFQIDNVRRALDWSFAPEGDAELGRALTIAAVPLWFHLSLINECRARVERAIASIAGQADRASRQEMQLCAALGWSEMYSTGRARETGAAWATALQIAERMSDTDYQLRSLWGLWAGRINNAAFRDAEDVARRFRALATRSSDPADVCIGERMVGATLHFLGDLAGARQHIETMLAGYQPPTNRSHIVRFQFDQVVTAQYTLARVLWTQGHPEQALECIESSVERALAIEHVLSLCNLLAQSACPVALLAGDVEAADRYVAMLRRSTRAHALSLWEIYGRLFAGQLSVARGNVDAGRGSMVEAVAELRAIGFNQYLSPFLIALAEASMLVGRNNEALDAVEEALGWSERTGEAWSVPEALRIKGELVERIGGSDAALNAEEFFCRSLELARAHGALSWELRTATSMARSRHRRRHRVAEARERLNAILAQFTEGGRLVDLRAARKLLDDLSRC